MIPKSTMDTIERQHIHCNPKECTVKLLLAEIAKSIRLIISAESQLVACEKELALAKKETARECAKIAEDQGRLRYQPCSKNGLDIANAIRARFGVDNG